MDDLDEDLDSFCEVEHDEHDMPEFGDAFALAVVPFAPDRVAAAPAEAAGAPAAPAAPALHDLAGNAFNTASIVQMVVCILVVLANLRPADTNKRARLARPSVWAPAFADLFEE